MGSIRIQPLAAGDFSMGWMPRLKRDHARILMDKGIAEERIRKYGFAFEGRTVLIG